MVKYLHVSAWEILAHHLETNSGEKQKVGEKERLKEARETANLFFFNPNAF